MIVKKASREKARKATTEELGVFTNRVHDLLTKLKLGKFDPDEVLAHLQYTASGILLVADLFKQRFVIPGVEATQTSHFNCLEEVRGVMLGCGSGCGESFGYDRKMNLPPSTKGLIDVMQIGRGVRPDQFWNFMLNGMESDMAITQNEIADYLIQGDRTFSPHQLKSLLERGNCDSDGSAEWSYNTEHHHYVPCLRDSSTVIFADVKYRKGGGILIQLTTSLAYLAPGDRVILKAN